MEPRGSRFGKSRRLLIMYFPDPPPKSFGILRKLFWYTDYLVDYRLNRWYVPKAEELKNCYPIDGFSFPSELTFLYTAAKSIHAPGVIVEIGSFMGRSTVAIGLGSKDKSKVYAVDPWNEKNKKIFDENMKVQQLNKVVIPLEMTSVQASKNWNETVRFLFIDGDHSFEGAQADFLSWKPFVSDGGMIAFHDSYFPGVRQVIENVKRDPGFTFQGELASLSFFMKGKYPLPVELTPFLKIQKVRKNLAGMSNSVKGIFGIDRTR
jgi:predicted O-methyltransferase YrrM